MISIFNARGLESHGVYINVSVSLREHLHEFKNGQTANPLSVFLCIALHTDSDGWSATPRGVLMRETGLGDAAITASLKHLRTLRIEGKRVLAHYRKVNAGKWGSSIYLLFPETEHGGPPDGWESISEQCENGQPAPIATVVKPSHNNRLYPVGRWQVELFSRLRKAYASMGRKAPQRFQTEEQQREYQRVSDVLGEQQALGLLEYALGVKAMTSLPQIVAYLRGCYSEGTKKRPTSTISEPQSQSAVELML